jgi:hypothetical protein
VCGVQMPDPSRGFLLFDFVKERWMTLNPPVIYIKNLPVAWLSPSLSTWLYFAPLCSPSLPPHPQLREDRGEDRRKAASRAESQPDDPQLRRLLATLAALALSIVGRGAARLGHIVR